MINPVTINSSSQSDPIMCNAKSFKYKASAFMKFDTLI